MKNLSILIALLSTCNAFGEEGAGSQSEVTRIIRRPAAPVRDIKNSAISLEKIEKNYGTGQFFIKANADGKEFRFLLDTGAKYTQIIDSPFFDSYRINGFIVSKSLLGRQRKLNTVSLRKITLGESNLANDRVAISKDLKLNLLGMKTLSDSCFAIDAMESKFRTMADCAKLKNTMPLTRYSEELVVIDVSLGDKIYPMIFDTGASMTVLDNKVTLPYKPEQITKETVKFSDSSMSSQTSHIFKAKEVQIGGIAFSDVTFIRTNLDSIQDSSDNKIMGILGFNLIQNANWTFDLANNRLSISKN
jgi:predicted aspartyl protease